MSDDSQRRAPPIKPLQSPGASPPTPAEPAAQPAATSGEGPTKTFTIKMESWLTDLAGSAAQVPVDDKGVPVETYPLDPFIPPPRGPTPVPPLEPPNRGPAPYYYESPPPPPARPAPHAGNPPESRHPPALPAAPSAPVASAVPPIPALAASAVPPIPGLAAGEPRFDEPRRSGPSRGVLLSAIVVALVGAGVAGWLLWGSAHC